jgi:hypothetical protein
MNYQDEDFSPNNPDSRAAGPSVNMQQLGQWIRAALAAEPFRLASRLTQSTEAGAGPQAASLQQPTLSILGPTHPFDAGAGAAYGAGTGGSPASSLRPYPDPATVAAIRKIRQEQTNAKLQSAGTLQTNPQGPTLSFPVPTDPFAALAGGGSGVGTDGPQASSPAYPYPAKAAAIQNLRGAQADSLAPQTNAQFGQAPFSSFGNEANRLAPERNSA